MQLTRHTSVRHSDEELIADLQRVFSEHGNCTSRTYRMHGKYSKSSIQIRFGTWTQVLSRAGLKVAPRNESYLSTDEEQLIPLVQPKRRLCLGCRAEIISINYHCVKCISSLMTVVHAEGWEELG